MSTIDRLIDFAFLMCALVVAGGVLMFIAGGIAVLLATTRPVHSCRDWRDHARGGRRHAGAVR